MSLRMGEFGGDLAESVALFVDVSFTLDVNTIDSICICLQGLKQKEVDILLVGQLLKMKFARKLTKEAAFQTMLPIGRSW